MGWLARLSANYHIIGSNLWAKKPLVVGYYYN